MDLKAKIAKAREALETASKTVEVEVAGELVTVVLRRVPGTVWADLVATHPPRPGTDGGIGFDTDAAVRAYPVEFVTVDGDPVTADTWAELFEVLSSPGIKILAAASWMLNQMEPHQRMIELGKARAGGSSKKRRSPAK